MIPFPASPRPRIENGAWKPVLQAHPRLLGPKAFLRERARSRPEAYKEIQADDSLLAVGIVHAVEGADPSRIAPHLKTARQNVARGVTNNHQDTWIWLQDAALAYDLFHDQFSPDERRAMVEWMNGHLTRFTDDENAFHNSTLSKILTYLRIAYATWGENPRAKEFRDYALTKLYEGKVLPVLREFGAGGGFTEAGWYARGSLWNLVQALEMARRVEGYDGFAKAPRFFYQRLAYEMFQPYPGLWTYGTERFSDEGDGSTVYGGHTEYPRHLRTVLASYYRGSDLARAVENKRRKGSNSAARLMDFLHDDGPEPPLPLTRFPLAHLAEGIGKVYARSDWTDDATWFRFECGDYWAAHQHFEVGNFEIYRRAPLATESGEYTDYGNAHAMNWLVRTIAHISILVHQPGEEWKNMRDGGRIPYANDGGQAKKWDWVSDTLEQWKAKRAQYERGDIVAYRNQPEFLFVAGDGTAAYSPAKLSGWVRQIVFLRPHTFVVFDRVTSAKPEYEKTWLLHTRNEPEMAGRTATARNGEGRLTVQTLLPERAAIKKIHGYTYGGQTFNPPATGLSAEANKWRIEVQPAAANREDLFLHVLSTEDKPRPARLLKQKEGVGVRVGDAEVVFKGRVGGSLRLNGKIYPLQAGIVRGPYE
ncbi:MAG: hypothetical protein KY468_17215 [Armatimonadetes bacterium]|nr:hypothetical protein [Armatimonadota bacterium]